MLEENAKYFPLKSCAEVVNFIQTYLESTCDPDLTFISIIVGFIENTLTGRAVNVPGDASGTSAGGNKPQNECFSNFPVVKLETITALYKKFQSILTIADEVQPKGRGKQTRQYANRDTIKRVSDVIWNSLIRSSYKDRAHLQSLFSYLDSNKLDCFGVALAVVAGCQVLGYKDVHLAISEDHAWVVFGKTQEETIEVTWHNKGTEDKRGQSAIPSYETHSWLYLAGNPVKCDRFMEVVAIVAAINPSLGMTSACLELTELQQGLLWQLYDMNHLKRYPMAIGCLAELEEVSATENRPTCDVLYMESVRSAQLYYKNHHVYPYTAQGGYFYRQIMYREAFSAWANAGDVIRLYNYSKDDEEIYKELQDIANEFIPQIMKTESSGHSGKSILRDAQCFANLLRFYDGICQWEEGSMTPILHIGWAKPLVNNISKFDYDIRSRVIIHCAKDNDDNHLAFEKNTDANLEKPIKEDEISETNNNVTKGEEDKDAGKTESDSKMSSLEALTAACGEKLLNPDFLLQGGGDPFTQNDNAKETCSKIEESEIELKCDKTENQNTTIEPVQNPTVETEAIVPKFEVKEDVDICEPKPPVVTLYSQKMKGLKDLLLAEKLNTQAISLQVTAQSQVYVVNKKRIGGFGTSSSSSIGGLIGASGILSEGNDIGTRAKRARRD